MKNKLHLNAYVVTIVLMGALLHMPFGYAVADHNKGISKGNASKEDIRVCYIAPTVQFNLYVKRHGLLVNFAEAAQAGQPTQTVYSVHGSLAEFGEFFSPLEGTLIVGSPTPNSNKSGARLGLYVHSLRVESTQEGGASQETESPQTLNCTSDEATTTPSSWHCSLKNGLGQVSESDIARSDLFGLSNCSQFH